MVDLEIVKRQGVSVETLKEAFRLDKAKGAKGEPTSTLAMEDDSKKGKINRLLQRIRSRIAGGRDYNLQNYRIYQALDSAWDLPLKQITPTMLMSLLDKKQEPQAVMDTLASWGIDPKDVLVEIPDPKTPSKTEKAVSIPAFFRVFIPLAKAYVTIRWAKLVNDRNQSPHFKYEPEISDRVTRMRSEVVTAAVENISRNYGMFDVEKDAIQRMLHYGQQILFPQESWHYETQVVSKKSPYKGTAVKVKKEDGKEADSEDLIEAVMREGIRYHQPHPARTYRDQAHFASTLNTGTGCSYTGYWRIMRYSEIVRNENFWNLDVIKIANSEWFTAGKGFFANVYPCTMQFPTTFTAAGGVSEVDSEKQLGDGFYTSVLEDRGILINEYFEKLNPKEHGLGEYDHEIWFRFVIAGDDTVIYAEPLPYTAPTPYYGYDEAGGRTITSSMTLEILPFQDHLGNLFSQYLISVKQNLFTLNLVDTDVVDTNAINSMRGFGNIFMTGLNVLPFSGQQFKTAQTSPKAVYSERFPQVDVNSIALAMRFILEMVERLLVMSPQEMGQSASHEQTREEVKVIAAQSSARLEFTAASADRAREAIKRQLYEGLMAYGEDEFYAQIPLYPDLSKEDLAKLGFTWKAEDKETGRLTIMAPKTAVMYEKFASNRDGLDRINERELAQLMTQFIAQMMGNPIIAQAIGPDQAITMLNFIAKGAGFPRDFKLVNKMNDQTLLQQNNEQLMKEVQQLVQQTVQKLTGDMKGALQTVVTDNEKQEQSIQGHEAAIQQMEQMLQQIEQALAPAAAAPPQPMLQPQPPRPMPTPTQDAMPMPAPPIPPGLIPPDRMPMPVGG